MQALDTAPGRGRAEAHAVGRGYLPVQLTSFVGRGREIAAVERLLGSTRLLTLTGAGGSGKTRLAVEVVGRVGGTYRDGVGWVELSGLSDAALLAEEVATTLGVRELPGRSATVELADALRPRHFLLGLDNCEHLVDACAALADALLRACPRLTILATSREALGIAGETAWLVPPLSAPGADAPLCLHALAEYEAVQLFTERARSVLPAFELTDTNACAVARICRRLDGIPLALELAAARMRVLAPEQIAQRLEGNFRLLVTGNRNALPRHQTLHAAIDWSYALLTPQERLLLDRLSLFAAAFTIEAAEAVCAGGDIHVDDVLTLIGALVDKSLVTMQECSGVARYRLLEAVRHFARERLAERGEEPALQRRHGEFFARLAEDAEPHLLSPRRTAVARSLSAVHDDIRAALAWAFGPCGAGDVGVRIAGSLWWFWHYIGSIGEARRWLGEALAAPAGMAPGLARARVLYGASLAAWMAGDHAAAIPLSAEAVALCRAHGAPRDLARALGSRAFALRDRGEISCAIAAAEECVAVARTGAVDATDLALSLLTLGSMRLSAGHLPQALALQQEAEAVWRSSGNAWGLSQTLHGLAMIALHLGRLDEALRHCREALAVLREERDVWFVCRPLEGLAIVLAHRRSFTAAARLLGAVEVQREVIGAPVLPFERRRHDATVAAIREALPPHEFATAWAEGRALTLERAIEAALAYAADGPADRATTAAIPVAAAGAATAPAAAGSATTGEPARPVPAVAGEPVPALRVVSLGQLRIERGGEPIPQDAWKYAKPRELLLYLLCHPAGRSREQIGLALWPDASPAQIRNSFHVTLHHLRKALGGPDWIVFAEDRYRLDPGLRIDFDAARFEEGVRAALSAHRSGADCTARLAEALSLYGGDFLEDEVVGDWHVELRDRLRRLHVDALFALGEAHFAAGRLPEAARAFEKLVRCDDLHEEAHRRLMACYARTGERARALRHYQRFAELLRAELDAEPERETTSLFARLQRGEDV